MNQDVIVSGRVHGQSYRSIQQQQSQTQQTQTQLREELATEYSATPLPLNLI
jgi:hypothetical protein